MALNSSVRVRELIKQYHSAQQRMTRATKKLRDHMQHYPQLQEILHNGSECEKWLRLTIITNQPFRDLNSIHRFFNWVHTDHLAKLNQKSNANNCYTSRQLQKHKMLFDNGCPWLKTGMDYDAMGQKWYHRLIMSLSHYPGFNNHNHSNQLHTVSPPISPVNHRIPIPPVSPDKARSFHHHHCQPSKGEWDRQKIYGQCCKVFDESGQGWI